MFTYIHDRLVLQQCKYVDEANILEYMIEGKSTLLWKYPQKERSQIPTDP